MIINILMGLRCSWLPIYSPRFLVSQLYFTILMKPDNNMVCGYCLVVSSTSAPLAMSPLFSFAALARNFGFLELFPGN